MEERIADNLSSVKERVAAAAKRSGRTADSIGLVAVTKERSVAEIQAVLAAGATDIGENRVQEVQQKYALVGGVSNPDSTVNSFTESAGNPVPPDKVCRWHLIGHLQRNKVKPAIEMFSLIHSVDSLRLLAEISRRSEGHSQQTDVLIQVNTTCETTKYGLDPDALLDFMEDSLTYRAACIVGLMTMGQLSHSPEANRPAFAFLRTLAEKVSAQRFPGVTMQHLSMGMTNDFEIAIEEGANLVRIGRAIFGTSPESL